MLTIITPSIRPKYLGITGDTLAAQTYQDFEWLIEPGFPARGFTLPSDFNNAIRRAKGDIIVILQDCISIPSDALEQIAKLNHENTAYTYPVGKEGESGIQWDWRKHTDKARNTAELPSPSHWEIDFGSAPRQMFFDVGGFDEDFNNGWSWENVELAYRASLSGYRFEVSRVTEGVALDHDKTLIHPFRGVRENNDRKATKSRVMADAGRVKLNFL